MRLRSALITTALLTALVPSAGAETTADASADAVSLASTGSTNLAHVANLAHAKAPGSTAAAKGSDIEFATLNVNASPQAHQAGVRGTREYAVMGTINIDGTPNSGMQVVDVTDPTRPVRVGLFECTNGQGDVQVFSRPDLPGPLRTFATYTTDSSGTTSSRCYRDAVGKGFKQEDSGTFLVEITNPYRPTLVQFIEVPRGSHNQTVHPSGRYLYNSNNELTRGPGFIEYFELADPDLPAKKLGELPLVTGIDSHDISFSPDGKRAYSAAITHTVIINTEDPANPRVVGRILDPSLGIQHQAEPVTITDPLLGTKTFLAITDEFAGAAGNGFCPGGGIGIYDVTGALEANPVRVGYWNMPETRAAGAGVSGASLRCTSHVLRFYPEQKLMTIGWYNAGTRIVDISGLVGAAVGVTPTTTGNVGPGMKEIGYRWFDDSETWAAKIHKFDADGSAYVFANDLRRGLDVFRFERTAKPSTATGTWLTAEQAAARPTLQLALGDRIPLCGVGTPA